MYRIVMPSRGRTRSCKKALSNFPRGSVTVTVDESELDGYRTALAETGAEIVPHPPLRGFARVFNWCIEHFAEECLFFVDDDIRSVRTTIPKTRRLRSPEDVQAIIENVIQVICDLDLTVCCFTRNPNTALMDPINEPIKSTMPVCVAFGIRGAARHRRYDETLIPRADADWLLRTLRDDRLVYCDMRFYFDNGLTFSGEGGNVGLVNQEQRDAATRELRKRWGQHINLNVLGFQQRKQKRLNQPLRIVVPRRNPAGLK